jgi:hypothetical protein
MSRTPAQLLQMQCCKCSAANAVLQMGVLQMAGASRLIA